MRFRCPNCQQAVRIESSVSDADLETVDLITCPSCASQFDLASTDGFEVGAPTVSRIEHFEIQHVLGEGTFGTVYKAWDNELERPVALKVPRAGKLHGDGNRQFLREARAAASITHPGVVAVHEIGQHDDSIYIACQFIEGKTLREHMRLGQLTDRDISELLIKILRAMHHFHEQGVVHRDIKPGNILLDEKNEPFIADFGLARREQSDEVTVTKSGVVVGTLGYMSPEQARGEVQALSGATDMYSVGAILYEMLTQTRPFVSTTSHTILDQIQNKDPTPPRKVSSRTARNLETICLKALEKDPDNRYANCSEMADDLQRFLDNKPILAQPSGLIETSLKWIRRNRVITALLLTTLVALIVAGVLSTRRPNDGTFPVRILVENSTATLRCVRYDKFLRVPDESGFTAEGTSGTTMYLKPGLYKFYADAENAGNHEVWRTIPDTTDRDSASQLFPHLSWTVDNGEIILQPFSVFPTPAPLDALVLIKGGTFDAGEQKQISAMSPKHSQTVDDFYMSVNEVSFGQFRELLKSTRFKSPKKDGIYFDRVCQLFTIDKKSPPDQPVTGFPVDVAILYCELAGGRLPTGIEWEYAATQRGTSDFPTGAIPSTEPQDWNLLGITEASSDETVQGIRNLWASAAEYTDSRMHNYQYLYPAAFPDTALTMSFDASMYENLPEGIEVRGAPKQWLFGTPNKNGISVRHRLMAPVLSNDSMKTFGRIGWRLCR